MRTFLLYRAWNIVAAYYWIRMHKYPSLLSLHRQFKRISNSTGVSIGDAVILYEAVRKDKPKHILEFGTGASTAYMALALMENEKENKRCVGTVVSVESEESFFTHQQRIFPKELQPYVDFVFSPVKRQEFDGQIGFVYESVPRHPYDLVWVDGPALTDSIRFSGDVIQLLPSCSRRVRVLFDGRDVTAETVFKCAGENFVLKKYPLLHMSEMVAK